MKNKHKNSFDSSIVSIILMIFSYNMQNNHHAEIIISLRDNIYIDICYDNFFLFNKLKIVSTSVISDL